MIVVITGDKVHVDQPEDLARLHIELQDGDRERADAALRAAGLGRLDENGGYLDIEALRELTGGQSPAFEHMVDYARGKGWVADGGRTLKAHVESDTSY